MPSFTTNSVKGNIVEVQIYIAQSAVLAHNLLYVAYKPGGASFHKEFHDTLSEHFFAGATSLFRPIFELTKRAILVAQNALWFDDAEIGFHIASGLDYARTWYQSPGNTILGDLIMFSPISLGSAYLFANEGMKTNISLKIDLVTEISEQFLKNSTTEDCIHLTKALNEHVSKNLLPSDKKEDNFNSFLEVHQYENTNLFEYTKFYEERDLIFYELSHRYQITRKIGLPTFLRVLEETHSFRKAITQTFIALLSEKKDTHIAKRFGNEIASEVKSRASEVLKNGGIFTEEGRKLLDELDHYLRFSNVRNINPGSTADLAATTTFFALLMGYRP
ncbi:MAG: triphosphoribosyl-dephospho-CoA synthase [Candidatus Heimdallarchaeaceae archaeon]